MVSLLPSTASNVIRHIHLSGVTPFHIAQLIQSTLVRRFLEHKKNTSTFQDTPIQTPAPIPTILTFQPTPVYTTGRRELQTPLSESLLRSLRKPLIPVSTTHLPTIRDPFTTSKGEEQIADVVQTRRGGLITFHGPGQLVIYPILDLRSFPNLGAKCYVNLLEEATIQTLRTLGMEIIGRTENPGVWVNEEEKIASLGIHLRRNISSYGVGLNMILERGWWDRIKACGLDGKRTVGINEELASDKYGAAIRRTPELLSKRGYSFDLYIAKMWVDKFLGGLGRLTRGVTCEGSETVGQDDIEKFLETGIGETEGSLRWNGWGDIPNEVKQLIPLDIRGGNELNISTGGGYLRHLHLPPVNTTGEEYSRNTDEDNELNRRTEQDVTT